MEGTITYFNKEKGGFGFVTDDSGEDYYVHQNKSVDNKPLYKGARIKFDILVCRGKNRAINIRRLKQPVRSSID